MHSITWSPDRLAPPPKKKEKKDKAISKIRKKNKAREVVHQKGGEILKYSQLTKSTQLEKNKKKTNESEEELKRRIHLILRFPREKNK